MGIERVSEWHWLPSSYLPTAEAPFNRVYANFYSPPSPPHTPRGSDNNNNSHQWRRTGDQHWLLSIFKCLILIDPQIIPIEQISYCRLGVLLITSSTSCASRNPHSLCCMFTQFLNINPRITVTRWMSMDPWLIDERESFLFANGFTFKLWVYFGFKEEFYIKFVLCLNRQNSTNLRKC